MIVITKVEVMEYEDDCEEFRTIVATPSCVDASNVKKTPDPIKTRIEHVVGRSYRVGGKSYKVAIPGVIAGVLSTEYFRLENLLTENVFIRDQFKSIVRTVKNATFSERLKYLITGKL